MTPYAKADLLLWLAALPEDGDTIEAVWSLRKGQMGASQRSCGRALGITAAAKRSGVSRMTIYRALRSGALQARPLVPGGRLRITETELDQWLRGAKPS
jgi:excisionase family DNA binding protein